MRAGKSQIVSILKEGEEGTPVAKIVRQHGKRQTTYYVCKARYGGARLAELKHQQELEAENVILTRMYADPTMESAAIKDLLSRKL